MKLFPCPLNVSSFNSDKKHKVFVAEASDLGFRAGQVPGGALYDDAADFGITLINVRGEKATFYESNELKDNGDVVVWEYKPTAETLRAFPKLEGWEVHILND